MTGRLVGSSPVAMVGDVIFMLRRGLLLLAVAVALSATGFAHRLPSPDDQALAFVLASGASTADICGDETSEGRTGGLACLACQIAGTADLPPLQGLLIRLELALGGPVIAQRESPDLGRVLDPANAPQGPPAA